MNSIITKRVIRRHNRGWTDSIITKRVIRRHNRGKDGQHYHQKKKDKGTNNDLQITIRKLKIGQHENTQIRGWIQLHDLLIYVAGLCTCMHLIMLNDLDGLFAVLYCAMMNLYITFKNLHKGNAWWIFRNNCTDEVFKTAVVFVIVW